MEKVSLFFTTLFHNYDFMSGFWFVVTFHFVFWAFFYFWRKDSLTEVELIKISPRFEEINMQYILSIILWGCVLLAVSASRIDYWSIENYGIRFYPTTVVFTASFGLIQGLFAIVKGVYPMLKSLSYIYDDISVIRRIGLIQTLLSVSAMIIAASFFFLTAGK